MSDPIPGPGNGQTLLSPAQRDTAWNRLGAEQFDVIVIGGGVVGAGAALDAATVAGLVAAGALVGSPIAPGRALMLACQAEGHADNAAAALNNATSAATTAAT